jgi:Protein of unknown function (DUF3352)
MRRLLATAVVLLAVLAAAGCGGGDDSGSALDAALAYLPKNTPLAIALDTDVEGDQYQALGKLADRFPFGDQVTGNLLRQFEQSSGGISFDDDLKPVLGNPAVLGASTAEAISGGSSDFVLAAKAKDEGALGDLVDKLGPKEIGEASGATLYQRGDSFFAVEGDMIAFAGDESQLKSALERADGDDHFDEDGFNQALEGLPDSALMRVYADLEEILKSDPGSVDARKVKWIGALRTLGIAARAEDDRIDVDFRARTEGDLADEDLPIAPGDDAPPIIEREGEIGLGIRDLAHTVRFGENAGQAIDPAGFGDYARAKQTIDKQLGVSLDDDLIAQLTGNVSASVSLDGGFGVRADLKDPQAFERTLAKVADVLPSFAQGAGFGRVRLTKPGGGQGFYVLSKPGGGKVVFGVVGEVLVVASDARRARELAGAEPVAVPGASGSVVAGADAQRLVTTLLERFGAAFGVPDLGALGTGLLTRPLGDLRGSVSADTGELRGKLTLGFD